MATTPVARRNAEARAAAAETQSAASIFEEIGRQQSTIKLSEIIEYVAVELGSKEIAKLLSKQIKSGSQKDQKMFLQELIRLVNTLEKKTAAISDNEVARLEDDQIDALLESQFGLQKKERDVSVAKNFRQGALKNTRVVKQKADEPAEPETEEPA